VVMGPVKSRKRFEPNEDVISAYNVHMDHITVGMKVIQRAIDISKAEE
jgi:hypothetical protein